MNWLDKFQNFNYWKNYKNLIYFYYNTKYFRNLSKNMNKFNITNDYLQEKIRFATAEMHRNSTLLMNLMFTEPEIPTTSPISLSDDNSDDSSA